MKQNEIKMKKVIFAGRGVLWPKKEVIEAKIMFFVNVALCVFTQFKDKP